MKANETNVHGLLQGTKVFLVPNFQRRYAWRLEEWQDLWDDLLAEVENLPADSAKNDSIDGHFLGSVVLHPAPGPASTVTKYLVIDGQQRLTTLIIILAALRDLQLGTPGFQPERYDNLYLTNPFDANDPDRLVPTTLDREAYTETIRKGNPTGGIGQAYLWFRDAISDWVETTDEAAASFRDLEQTVLLRVMFVEITTSKDDAVNTIFNTLNSKGKPLSAADLIRNELMLYLAPEKADAIHQKHWLPVERALTVETKTKINDRNLVGYFWSRELAHSPNVALKDLFSPFQRRLKKLVDANGKSAITSEIQSIFDDHDLYKAILNPEHAERRASNIPASSRQKLQELADWGSAPHVPVSYALLKAHAEGRADEQALTTALDALLSYLVRRSLAGLATNNLNRMLSGLPSNLAGSTDIAEVTVRFLSRAGTHWPSDDLVLRSAPSVALYMNAKRAQVRYILRKIEFALDPKEPVDTSRLQIEHIFPQKPSPAWLEDLAAWGQDAEDMRAVLHTIGNLTLTGHNATLSNKAISAKVGEYSGSSLEMNLALQNTDRWTVEEVHRRANDLLAVSLKIWRGPDHIAQNRAEITHDRLDLRDLLDSLPDGYWVTTDVLVEVMAAEEDEIRSELANLSTIHQELVRDDSGKTLDGAVVDNVAEGRAVTVSELAESAGLGDAQEGEESAELDEALALSIAKD